jgi:uncharacterized protein with von Willebrand factor type A (vWA) domain
MDGNLLTYQKDTGGLCRRCLLAEAEDSRALSEIALAGERSAEDLLTQVDAMPGLRKKAGKKSQERLEQQRQRLMDKAAERIGRGDIRKQLEEQIEELGYQPEEEINSQDLQGCLGDYVEQGYLDWDGGEIKITSKGARKLGGFVLNMIIQKLIAREVGPHYSPRIDYGSELSASTRKYELGDEYHRIDFEKTFLSALERNSPQERISLELEDLHIYDEMHESKMCAGLIIDQSGSMQGDKISAAVATALALAELIRREPKDLLKVYLFASQVREVPYYDMVNATRCRDSTDIRGALRAFRKGVLNEKGDKQAYLITDAEANTEDGRSVGFNEATLNVMREALYYRQAGITLNIIMLDENPYLREFASILAKRNLGRVIFTSPSRLGEVVIKDYLASKNKGYLDF